MKYGNVMLSIYPRDKGVTFKIESIDSSEVPDTLVNALREFCIPLKARDIVVAYTTSHTEEQVMMKLRPLLEELNVAV